MSVTIRECVENDFPQLVDLHAKMELGYQFNPARKDFLVRSAAFDEKRLVACVLGRLTTEAYLLLDREWADPKERLETIGRLALVSAETAKLYGVQDTHIWLPPRVKNFCRRLKRMGFVEAPWKCMSVNL
jgi:hypothetical protein